MNNSMQISKRCLFICMTYFVFMPYSITLYYNYLNKRKKYFEKIFNGSSCLGFTSLNFLPTCFLCKQCNSPSGISTISLKYARFFHNSLSLFPNLVIFLPTFSFMLITHHNIMACNLEWDNIAIKCCFGVRQPHLWCFL